jgi:hypothetical protein
VSIRFVEFEGEKKTKSLPCTLVAAPSAKIHMGSCVPYTWEKTTECNLST